MLKAKASEKRSVSVQLLMGSSLTSDSILVHPNFEIRKLICESTGVLISADINDEDERRSIHFIATGK